MGSGGAEGSEEGEPGGQGRHALPGALSRERSECVPYAALLQASGKMRAGRCGSSEKQPAAPVGSCGSQAQGQVARERKGSLLSVLAGCPVPSLERQAQRHPFVRRDKPAGAGHERLCPSPFPDNF